MRSPIMAGVATCALLLLSEALLRAQSVDTLTVASDKAPASVRLDQLQTRMHEARGRSDWVAYLVAARQVEDLLNGSPQSQLEVARAEMHAGRADAAFDRIATYVRMGQSSEAIEKLPDFADLRQRKDFDAVRKEMATNLQSVARSTVAFRIPDPGLLAEDIDVDPRSMRFFVSSVLQHRIVSIARDAPLLEFARAPNDWPVMAIKIDVKRQVLWATEVAIESFEAIATSDRGRSAVLCYDLNTGKLLRRIEGPRLSALGDMAITEDGGLIVSDGNHGGLYRLRSGSDQLERLDRGDFISPQTVAMASGGAHVYVPDYVRGLGVFDLATKQVRWLPMAGRFAIAGIDGLYVAGNNLVAIQNGTSPTRVVAISMNAAASEIVEEQIIERATTTLGDPTHGVIVDGVFYYIANSGWDALDANGSVKPGVTMTEPTVMQWKLPSR